MTARHRLGLLGATGRMGRIVSEVIRAEYASRAELVHEFTRASPPGGAPDLDAIVDFSLPEAVLTYLEGAGSAGTPPALAIASTGWNQAGHAAIAAYAERAPVIVASNYSLGIHVMRELLKNAAPLLSRLGYTPVLVEAHHRHKRDAPSGTAVSLRAAINPKDPSSVQTHSIRAGEVIGDHAVTFYGAADELTLTHSAADRSIFARGAIEAALWLSKERHRGRTGIIPFEEFADSVPGISASPSSIGTGGSTQ